MMFMDDLRTRLANRVQITSDGHEAYLEAVEGAFGADIDYARLVKIYGASPDSMKGRYSPAEGTGICKTRVEGDPAMEHVSTSYVERQNLTMRMHNRRFTRLANAFSKLFENHARMVALYAVWYDFVRVHKSLCVSPRHGGRDLGSVVEHGGSGGSVEAADAKPEKREPYRKR